MFLQMKGWGSLYMKYSVYLSYLPIYIYLQAMACKLGWLKYKSALSGEFSSI